MANISKIRLSGTTYTIYDDNAIHSLDGYATSEQVNNVVTAASAAVLETVAEAGYQNATEVNNAITAVTNPINETLTAHTANTTVHIQDAERREWNDKIGDVAYDSETKRINFYTNSKKNNVVAYVDASDFIKDGMVSNVEIKEVEGVNSLVITFNSDAGKSDIAIPISSIFNADNYYTTAQTQTYISNYTYDKDTIDQKISDSGTFDPTNYYNKSQTDTLLNAKANTATTYTKAEVDNAITAATNTKQDTLVSGTNIKTVGTQSVLGSGNIALMTARVGTGEDATTLIFEFA